MDEQLSKNVRALMQQLNISANALAQATGLPATTIKRIRSRRNNNPTLSSIVPIAKYFRVTLSQLMGEEPLPDLKKMKQQMDLFTKLTEIPLYTLAQYEEWLTNKTQHNVPLVVTEQNLSARSFALQLNQSDWSLFPSDSTLVVDPKAPIKNHSYAMIYQQQSKKISIKQLIVEDQQIFLQSLISKENIVKLNTPYQLIGTILQMKKNFN